MTGNANYNLRFLIVGLGFILICARQNRTELNWFGAVMVGLVGWFGLVGTDLCSSCLVRGRGV